MLLLLALALFPSPVKPRRVSPRPSRSRSWRRLNSLSASRASRRIWSAAMAAKDRIHRVW